MPAMADEFGGSLTLPEYQVTSTWMEASAISPERVTEIIEVLRAAYNGGPRWFRLDVRPEDHLLWKIRDQPGGGAVTLTLDASGRTIGFSGSMHRRWLLRGRRVGARDGVDVCLHPEWQGRGLNRALGTHRGRDWHPVEQFNLGYETHPVLLQRALERGDKAPANKTHEFLLPLNPLRMLEELRRERRGQGESDRTSAPTSRTRAALVARARGRSHALGRLFSMPWRLSRAYLGRRPAPRGRRWQPATLDAFDERFAPFWEAAAGQFDFIQERTPDYLNWRFIDRRAGPFIVRAAIEDDTVLGYAATQILGDQAYLADLLALPNREDVAEALVRDSIALARRRRAPWLRTRLPRVHPYRAALRRVGFIDLGHRAGELIDPRAMNPLELAVLDDEAARIHLTLADSDAV